ncbi:MAG TPA: glycosyltransferase family 2 protein [Candidatus Didemnitutus sp.]|nr:glycosyltransferase family 2 protein [Candidatus Didemnitutus sp.]
MDAAVSPASAVGAIVVTYHPGPAVLANLAALRSQVGHVFVIENTADASSGQLLSTLSGDPGIEVVFNPANFGLAAALNQGLKRALACGCEWIATFDQDSTVPAGYVDRLLAARAARPATERIAVLAPLYRDKNLGFLFSPAGPLVPGDESSVSVSVTATSGNLVSAAALAEVGGWRSDYFIDCVDFEFCLRCRRAGWTVLEVRSVVLDHEPGRWQQREWFGKARRFNDYSAERRYYQARNRVPLYARYAGFDPRWVTRDAWGYACDLVKLLLFCTDRPSKIGAAWQGFWHGLAGRLGPRWR